MSEKSFKDLAHDDEHLAEKKISGQKGKCDALIIDPSQQ
jgi:hypothetical protein